MIKKLVDLYLKTRRICRLTARRLGLQSYQVHQIYLKRHDLIYIPIPKNASTTLKHAMHYLEHCEKFDLSKYQDYGYKSLHDFYNKKNNALTSVEALKKQNAFCFTVIRDPIERFLSCYGNRILKQRDLQKRRRILDPFGISHKPDLNTFAINLTEYRRIHSGIRHHTKRQSNLLGGTLKYFDRVFPFEQMNSVKYMLKSFDNSLKLKNRKSDGPKFQLSDLKPASLQFLLEFYKKDYQLLNEFYSRKAVLQQYRRER